MIGSTSTQEGTNTSTTTSTRSSMLQRSNHDNFNDAQLQGMPSDHNCMHVNMSPSTEDQMSALLHAISLVSKLAGMDSAAYHKDLEIVTDQNAKIQTKEQIQTQLDHLQSQWKLEETPIPSLIASTHRLQSNIGHLQQESTNLTSQFNINNSTLQQTQEQNSKLKKACRKLYSHNRKLVQKLQKKKEDSRHFISTVKDFVSQKKQEELDKEELVVACHEAMLKNQMRHQGRGVSASISDSSLTGDASNAGMGMGTGTGMGGNRARTNTAESNFSDLDTYSYLGDYSIFEGEEETDGSDGNDDNNNDDTSYHCVANPKITGTSNDIEPLALGGCFDSSASFDLIVTSPSRSLVTDDAIATVRFVDPFAASHLNSNHMGIGAGNDDANDNANAKGGADKFKKSVSFDAIDQRSRASLNVTPAPSRPSSHSSHLQTYTLSFPRSREIGLQFTDVSIPIPASGSSSTSNRNLKTSSLAPSVGTRNRASSDSSVLNLSVVDECQEIISAKSNVMRSPPRASKSMFGSPDTNMFKAFSSPGRSSSIKEKSIFTTMENMFGIQTPKKKKDHAGTKLESPRANDSSSQQTAILVKDFQGFDTSLNIRPAVGARLIAINNLSLLEGKWTLQKMTNFLEGQRSLTGQSNNDIKLTFRNDPVGKIFQKKGMEETASARVVHGGTIAVIDAPSPKVTKKVAMSSPVKSIRLPKITLPTTQRTSDKKSKPFFNVANLGGKSSNGDDSASFFGFTITGEGMRR